MQQHNFHTHVWVSVRVKVESTNFSNDPAEIQEKVADAVVENASDFIKTNSGTIVINGASHVVKDVEISQEISYILVDQENLGDKEPRTVEHHFDHLGHSMKVASGFATAKEYEQSLEIEKLKRQLQLLQTSAAVSRISSLND